MLVVVVMVVVAVAVVVVDDGRGGWLEAGTAVTEDAQGGLQPGHRGSDALPRR